MIANQSRGRSGPSLSGVDIPYKHVAKFTYQPLDPLVDCIRLVELEPAEDFNSPVFCKLVAATFGQKPKYEALSYTWGDQTVKRNIFLDGKEFEVGLNLWDALSHLRNRVERLPLWIDSISINQEDVPERNRQLRIMPHIYTRAKMVLVWLGKKGSEYTSLSDNFGTDDKALTKELCANDYWDRVWIIQEIGKARRIQICFGEHTIEWEKFIIRINRHGVDENCGPLRLERQLHAKYAGGHTFRNLLESHKSAMCKDPRDKIYGFVGLATDCYGFPMDYQKSPLEVWKDTMMFVNAHKTVPRSDMVHFGRLVKHLLGGDKVATIEQVVRENALHSNPVLLMEMMRNHQILEIEAYIAGEIGDLGPSPEEIISDLNRTDEWTESIRKNFSWDVGKANWENDLFMQGLEECDEADLTMIQFSHTYIPWQRSADGKQN